MNVTIIPTKQYKKNDYSPHLILSLVSKSHTYVIVLNNIQILKAAPKREDASDACVYFVPPKLSTLLKQRRGSRG